MVSIYDICLYTKINGDNSLFMYMILELSKGDYSLKQKQVYSFLPRLLVQTQSMRLVLSHFLDKLLSRTSEFSEQKYNGISSGQMTKVISFKKLKCLVILIKV